MQTVKPRARLLSGYQWYVHGLGIHAYGLSMDQSYRFWRQHVLRNQTHPLCSPVTYPELRT
jgi:hypothetical protein